MRSRSVRAARFDGGDAVARVAAGPREAAGRVDADGRPPRAAHAENSLPRRRDVCVDAEEVAHTPAQVLDDRARRRRLARRPRAEDVRIAAAAERDPPVGRPLEVRVEVAAVEHRLAAVPAELRPDVGGKRLGRDHRARHRRELAAQAGQVGGVRLRRADDPARGHLAARSADAARLELECRRPLVDRRRPPARRRRRARARASPAARARSAG